jgi:hypothetical protein
MNSTKETRKLSVKLNEEECRAKGKELASENRKLEVEKASMKAVAKSMKENIEMIEKHIADLSEIVNSESEDREVECYEIRNERLMTVEVYRADLHELVSTRPMSASERQLVMFPELHEVSNEPISNDNPPEPSGSTDTADGMEGDKPIEGEQPSAVLEVSAGPGGEVASDEIRIEPLEIEGLSTTSDIESVEITEEVLDGLIDNYVSDASEGGLETAKRKRRDIKYNAGFRALNDGIDELIARDKKSAKEAVASQVIIPEDMENHE